MCDDSCEAPDSVRWACVHWHGERLVVTPEPSDPNVCMVAQLVQRDGEGLLNLIMVYLKLIHVQVSTDNSPHNRSDELVSARLEGEERREMTNSESDFF